MTTYFGTIATDQPDQDGTRFSREALQMLWEHAQGKLVLATFDGPEVGRVASSALRDDGVVEVLAEVDGELQEGVYVVPQFSYDPKDVTEENGVKVYHKVNLMALSLTGNPSDPHLAPLKLERE